MSWAAHAFVQGVFTYELFELTGELGVPAECERRIEAIGQSIEPEAVQAARFLLDEGQVT